MEFTILLDPRAIEDIQESIAYYEQQEPGVGNRFEHELHKHLSILKKDPFFQIRYDQVRCLPLRKFPHMIHFTTHKSKKIVVVRAVFHTSKDPGKWTNR
jgi:hypothetical protein